MAQCVTKMVLDVSEREVVQSIVARQGDSGSRSILLRLFAYGELLRVEENSTVVLNVRNATEQTAMFAGEVNADGSVSLPLNAWMLREEGILTCDVSVFDEAGSKLTTPSFEIEVIASVLPSEVLPGDDEGGESVTAEIIQQERMLTLKPIPIEGGFLLSPEDRRHYTLDLTGNAYGTDESWCRIKLMLPPSASDEHASWVVITCHAPLRACGAVPIDWGNSNSVIFVGSLLPEIRSTDFDIICTFSSVAGKWQIGVVQYGNMGAAV